MMRNLMVVGAEISDRIRMAKAGLLIRKAGLVLAAGAICLTSQAIAQDQARPEVKKEARVKTVQAAETTIPECMEKLKLTLKQANILAF